MRSAGGLAVVAAFGLGACGTTPAPGGGVAPPDFTLSVTVVDREDSSRPVLTRALRPARYILEPDGVLRASVGPGTRATTYPPAIRTLTHTQVQEVWRAVESAAFLAADPRQQVADTETRAPVVVRPTALVYVAADGRRRSLQVPLDRPDAGSTRAVIDRLAGLAWVGE